MNIGSIWKAVPLLAMIVASAACDGASDAESSGCECASADDNYCNGQQAMQCDDGCHFTPHACDLVADCESGCFDGECWEESDCCGEDVSECTEVGDSYCEDDEFLVECLPDDPCWNHGVTDCLDDVNCPCGSGCVEEDGIASCWCCQPDAGVDGGV